MTDQHPYHQMAQPRHCAGWHNRHVVYENQRGEVEQTPHVERQYFEIPAIDLGGPSTLDSWDGKLPVDDDMIESHIHDSFLVQQWILFVRTSRPTPPGVGAILVALGSGIDCIPDQRKKR